MNNSFNVSMLFAVLFSLVSGNAVSQESIYIEAREESRTHGALMDDDGVDHGDLSSFPEPLASEHPGLAVVSEVRTSYDTIVRFLVDENDGLLVVEEGRGRPDPEVRGRMRGVQSPSELFSLYAGDAAPVPEALQRLSEGLGEADSWSIPSEVASASDPCSEMVGATGLEAGKGSERAANRRADKWRNGGDKSLIRGKNVIGFAGLVCVREGLASWSLKKQNCNACNWTWLVNGNDNTSWAVGIGPGHWYWWWYNGKEARDDFNYESTLYFPVRTNYVHNVAVCGDYYNRTRKWPGSCAAGGCRVWGPEGTIPGTAWENCRHRGIDPSGIINPWP